MKLLRQDGVTGATRSILPPPSSFTSTIPRAGKTNYVQSVKNALKALTGRKLNTVVRRVGTHG